MHAGLHNLTYRWACNISEGKYIYTADLLQLEAQGCDETSSSSPHTVHTLLVERWDPFLSSHPDQAFAAYIRRGLREGFRIGVPVSHRKILKSACRNHPSANSAPDEVAHQLTAEVEAGRLCRSNSRCHVSPMGLIPKSGGKWRLIVDLSSPRKASVNEGINPEWCSLKYAAIDQALLFIRQLGRGSQLAKFDLKSAYRMVPIHPDDQQLLGISWQGATYTNTALPFGLRSAPKIFSAVADMLAWAMVCNGVKFAIHYLDDFLIFGPPDCNIATDSLERSLRTCAQLQFPVATEKTAGPATSLVFLGI